MAGLYWDPFQMSRILILSPGRDRYRGLESSLELVVQDVVCIGLGISDAVVTAFKLSGPIQGYLALLRHQKCQGSVHFRLPPGH